ncbi:hypothetical protein E0H73_14380 [Kribbella pittospori]|uniref:Gfo/Idh/MocA-like oxidoreductase C-terminal domain-containing protein n=1 Tax=Kribbella pittospori TaxID=722689 RepID=A0A4R0KNY0_9ACTN|nr:hypothetical protein [Kribbella pittospori]TCC61920.1 hypothetical protein E0H73_14380 [Kribbella pittospori]
MASQIAAGSSNALSIAVDGHDGAAEWSLSDSEVVTVTDRSSASSLRTDSHAPASVAGEFWRSEPAPDSARRAMFTDFYSAVSTRTRPSRLPTFADGARHVHLVADASEALVPASLTQTQGDSHDPALSA